MTGANKILPRIDQVDLSTIANEYGTPCYVYSKQKIITNFKDYQLGFGSKPHLICYSVKANSNLAILKILADYGAGFDIVSGGELARVLALNIDPKKIVFSGVGKSESEITKALKKNIACFNVESFGELAKIEYIAQKLNLIANISIRVNPDIDAKTHPYISTGLKDNKFGIDINEVIIAYQKIAKSKYLKVTGINCHIGSQLTELNSFADTINKILQIVSSLDELNINLSHIDFGGGLGINYQNETIPKPSQLTKLIAELTANRDETIIIEPGRSIVGDAGILLTKVEYLKSSDAKNFCIVDAAMNDLIRPSLYQAYQQICNTKNHLDVTSKNYDVVGPVCETGDFLGKDRNLAVKSLDILAVKNSGAYGFVMASNYNTRGRPAEVLIEGNKHKLIRARETVNSLFANELELLHSHANT